MKVGRGKQALACMLVALCTLGCMPMSMARSHSVNRQLLQDTPAPQPAPVPSEPTTPPPPAPSDAAAAKVAISRVGRGYPLYKTNILLPDGLGVTIFNVSNLDCFDMTDDLLSDSSLKETKSTQELRDYMSNTASLSGSYAGFTLDASTSFIQQTKTSESVTSVILEARVLTKTIAVNADCLNPDSLSLNRKLVDAFKKLPVFKKDANVGITAQQLLPYRKFIDTYGSHYVSSISLGAFFRRFAYTTSQTADTEKELKIKACAGYANSVTNSSIKACDDYTQENSAKTASSSSDTQVKTVGGDKAVLAGLATPPADNVDKFLTSGFTSTAPAVYRFAPIWDLLFQLYDAGDLQFRAMTLKAYYQGWLEADCQSNKILSSGLELGRFALSALSDDGSFPIYQCLVPSGGCRSDDACVEKYILNSDDKLCVCCGPQCVVNNLNPGKRFQMTTRPHCKNVPGQPRSTNPATNLDTNGYDRAHSGGCPHNTCRWTGQGPQGCACNNDPVTWTLAWQSGSSPDENGAFQDGAPGSLEGRCNAYQN